MISLKKAIAVCLAAAMIFGTVSMISAGAKTVKAGDADLNGKVNVVDATIIQMNVAGLNEFSDAQKTVADLDKNGKIEITDATTVQKISAEQEINDEQFEISDEPFTEPPTEPVYTDEEIESKGSQAMNDFSVKLLKGRFFSIHAIDASGPKAGNKDVALGSGVIDLVTIMNELKKNEKGTVYITVEDEWQHDDLESAVAASARWFNAWKRGELAPDGRVRADAIAGLWKDVDAANPSGWDAKALGLVDDIAQRVSQMRAIGLDKSSFKSDEKGMAPNENVDAAFAGEGRKFCRPWKGMGYVSCDATFLVAANYYTISSANDDPSRDPVTWVLYGSKDGHSWVELDRRDNVKFTMRHQLRGFQIKNPQMSRSYKIVFHKNNGGRLVHFSRVAFYE